MALFSWFRKAGRKRSHGTKGQKNGENPFVVTITDEIVQIEHPKRKAEKVRWDDIIEIWMVNTDEGPFAPDVWMALVGTDGGCLIPTSDCDGYEQVYAIVSKYDGFDFQKYTDSMCCAHNERFVLWRKER